MVRILAIHAHPDDIEILAGGTMAILAKLGHQIVMATMTPGDCGSREYPPDEIAAIRRREAASAAAMIGAEYVCVEFRDLAIFNDDASRRRVTEILRRTQPEIVLAASPVDYHCDHEAASALVRDACFAAPAPNYRTGAENPAQRLPVIPHLYYMDPVGGVQTDGTLVTPDFVVNVESTFETKRRMLIEHASQRKWLQQHHGTDDYIEAMVTWTRKRGTLARVPYGEGLRQYRGHPYPETPLLQEILADNVAAVA